MSVSPPERLMRWPEVHERTAISKVYAWRLRRQHRFPEPVRLGPNVVAWLESDVMGWIEERRRERDQRLAAR